jgi:thiol-disulfide isomerase/thioredoxin
MLNELAKEYEPKGLQVVGVNYDQEGDLILMRRFIARYKPVFPNFRKKQGNEAEFTQAVMAGWSGALPASFFYNKYGKQVDHILGASSREIYENAIRQLLAEDSASR